jgi:hypothetical protein
MNKLDGLWAAAAIATGNASLHVFAASEADLMKARQRLETLLGLIPQADVIEPWDEHPDDPWELRLGLGSISAETWLSLRPALADLDCDLRPGLQPSALAALDMGLVIEDVLDADGVEASLWVHVDDGEVDPELVRAGAPDADTRELEAELLNAVRAVDARLQCTTDRGPDTAQMVVHPHSGRFGLRLVFDQNGPDLPVLRQAILREVARVVSARENHPVVRLAPDARWSTKSGFSLTLWIIGSVASRWPFDDGLSVPLSSVPVELQRPVMAPQPVSSELHGPWGGPLRFVNGKPMASWTADEVLPGWADDARVVPLPPFPVEEWTRLDPGWTQFGQRTFLRARDGARDRDLRWPATRRNPDAQDESLIAQLEALAAMDIPVDPARAMTTEIGGAPALSIPIPGDPVAVLQVAAALGGLRDPRLGRLALWSLSPRAGMVNLLYKGLQPS